MPRSIDWEGSYYDGQSLVPQNVRITLETTGLHLHTSTSTSKFWNYQEIRQTQGRYSGEEVRLEHGTGIGETLIVPNVNILVAIHQQGGAQASHFHHPGTRIKRVYWTIFAAIACLPIIYGIFTWGIPWFAGPITAGIPTSWETQLGQFVEEKLTAEEHVCKHTKLTTTLNSMMSTLTNSIDDHPYTFHVTIVDSPVVNAVAAPGGYLIVFRGLLQDTSTPEELAGVLAHEIQHVLLRHGMQLIVRHVSMAFIIAALSGDASGIASYALQAAQTLQTLSYSRNAEQRADEQGLQLLQQAEVNPSGMLTFFTKLAKKQTIDSPFRYLSTHPAARERINNLKTLMGPTSNHYRPFSFQSEWGNIRELCDASLSPSK